MYYVSSVLIVIVVYFFIYVAIEVGYRYGLKHHEKISNLAKSQINAFMISTLGMLALLLGFTFSASLRHYDLRVDAVVDEANAIGTVYLRADLLPSTLRSEAVAMLREYLELRIQLGYGAIKGRDQHEMILAQAAGKLDKLWIFAMRAAEMDAGPVTSGLFIQSLNVLIDSFGKGKVANTRHVPVPIFIILFGTFVLTGAVVGYASGAEGHRVTKAAYLLVLIIVLMVFATTDIDRPQGGLIKVRLDSLTNLQSFIN